MIHQTDLYFRANNGYLRVQIETQTIEKIHPAKRGVVSLRYLIDGGGIFHSPGGGSLCLEPPQSDDFEINLYGFIPPSECAQVLLGLDWSLVDTAVRALFLREVSKVLLSFVD